MLVELTDIQYDIDRLPNQWRLLQSYLQQNH